MAEHYPSAPELPDKTAFIKPERYGLKTLPHRLKRVAAYMGLLTLPLNSIDMQAGAVTNAATPDTSYITLERSVDVSRVNFVGLPGFNTEAEGLKNNLEPVVSRFGDTDIIKNGKDYSNEAVYAIVAMQLEKKDPYGKLPVVLIGHSAGGIMSVEVAAKLHKNGYDVSAIIFDSSPYDASTVQPDDRVQAEMLAKLRDVNITAGRAQRSAVEGIKKMNDSGSIESAIHAASYTYTNTSPEKSWEVITAQAKMIGEAAEILPDAAAMLADSDVEILHITPLREDKLVQTELAAAGWEALFGDKYHRVSIDGGHTIKYSTRDQYAAVVAGFLNTQVFEPAHPNSYAYADLR